MKDLNLVTPEEQRTFFKSFDYVFCDIDGTLWLAVEPIPGANAGITSLQKLGKTVVTVSNNTTFTTDTYHDLLNAAGFNIAKENITTPSSAICSYLQKINFDREIYILGMDPIKKLLSKAGFKLINGEFRDAIESIKQLSLEMTVDSNVGAVVYDVDFNVNFMTLQKTCEYLKQPETLFLAGAPDKMVPMGKGHIILGPGCFQEIISAATGKKPIVLAKPSAYFGSYLVEKFNIPDRARILFVGDSVPQDMGIAANSGFQKLLVLSGVTKKEDVDNWSCPEEYKPQFYVDSLGTVHDIIKRIFSNEM